MPSTLQKQPSPPERFNEDGKCIPRGKCPDGYGWLDNDETGRCYSERDIKTHIDRAQETALKDNYTGTLEELSAAESELSAIVQTLPSG